MLTIQHLRKTRKRSCLKQDDVAFLFGYRGCTLVSQWENGKRKPLPQKLVLYHFLFDEPLMQLFIQEKERFCSRLKERITALQGMPPNRSRQFRITYLTQTLERLTTPTL